MCLYYQLLDLRLVVLLLRLTSQMAQEMINYEVTVYFLQNSDLVRSFCSEDSERKRSCCYVNGHTRSFRQQQVLLWMKHKYLHVPLSQGYYVSSVPIKTFPFKKWQKNIVHHLSCNNSNKHQRKTMVTNALEVYELHYLCQLVCAAVLPVVVIFCLPYKWWVFFISAPSVTAQPSLPFLPWSAAFWWARMFLFF